MAHMMTDRGIIARHAGKREGWSHALAAIKANGGVPPQGRRYPSRKHPARVAINRAYPSRAENMATRIVSALTPKGLRYTPKHARL